MNGTRLAQKLAKLWACLTLAAVLPAGLLPSAEAEAAITLDVQAGFNGEFKESALVPVRVSITNKGPDTEGEVVVMADDGGRDGSGTVYFQPVSVAQGAAKEVTIAVPGELMRNSRAAVSFRQDGELLAQARVNGRSYPDDYLMIGVLANDPDTANFLGLLRDSSYRDIKVLPLTAEQVPETAVQLGTFDLLVLNNFPLDALNGPQREAIRQWTLTGGNLVLAGGAQFSKTAGTLAELSPVNVRDVATVQRLTEIRAEGNAPALNAPLTVSVGEVKEEGRVLYQEGNIPLMAAGEAEKGKVLYVAYDLAAEPLASWSGNAAFWQDALSRAFGVSLGETGFGLAKDQMWSLANASERMPALKMPSVGWFAVLFGIYALVAGPILFYILRIKRKQSWMWGLVPALAVVTGMGMFGFGAMQRGTSVLVHQTGFVELNGKGQADARAVTAMFVPASGDYELTIHTSGATQPYEENRFGQTEPQTWVRLDDGQAKIRFRDVEFWAMRKAATRQVLRDAGEFTADLTYANGTLTGTVTNNTRFSLRDVRVVSGIQVQEFARIAPGETIQVDLAFEPSVLFPNIRLSNQSGIFVPQSAQSQTGRRAVREEMIARMMERKLESVPAMGNVMIAGWTEQPLFDTSVDGKAVQADAIALVTSSLEVKPSQGGLSLYPASSFKTVMSDRTAEVEDTPDGFYMGPGEVTFDIALTSDGKRLEIHNLYLYTWSADGGNFVKQVYNWRKQAYEPLDDVFADGVLEGGKAAGYLSPDGVLRLKFAHHAPEKRLLGEPYVIVEGKVIAP